MQRRYNIAPKLRVIWVVQRSRWHSTIFFFLAIVGGVGAWYACAWQHSGRWFWPNCQIYLFASISDMTTTSTHTTYNVIAFQARDACILHLIVGGETWRLQQHSFPGCQMVLFFSFFFVFVGCECRLAAVEMSPTSSMEYYYYHPNRFLSLSLLISIVSHCLPYFPLPPSLFSGVSWHRIGGNIWRQRRSQRIHSLFWCVFCGHANNTKWQHLCAIVRKPILNW